ncbi:MAG TPA: penicillin-binding transpeptidase domain-containing protein [Dermatophilaceae bacterium]|nr:penicillin-binding protein [Actinomycetales bacterium]HMT32479.1 penicillin-binding transpeptidase domain-containing protein [Dermatophilaceae bacterium]HMT88357.1 penicillin-binding transpeptidase domain-containing protein [Dermatophilaceae bacterium]
MAHRPVARRRTQGSLRAAHAATASALALVLVLALALAGCTGSSEPPPPTPESTAAALAAGLSSGDLSRMPFDGSTPEAATTALGTVVAAIKDIPRTVTVVKVVDKTAAGTGAAQTSVATLQWTWDVSPTDADWTYTTDAKLVLNPDKTWHVQWSPTLIEGKLDATERFTVDRVQGKRGEILGAGGEVLAGLRDVYQVGIDKSRVTADQAAASATALATLMGIDPTAYGQTVAASGPKQFVVAITLRTSDPRIAGKTASVQVIPGAAAVASTATLGPTPTFARAILGTVGPATAEIVQRSGGRVSATDTVGLSGLQQRYDGYLAGTPGMKIKATGTSSGTAVSRTLFSQDPIPGKSLTVTLDLLAQEAAEEALAGSTVPATLVAIRPSTGEVVAAANSPTATGAMATTGRAAPGSTFKIVSSLALLRAGLTPDSSVSCPATTVVDGRTFKNYDDYPSDRVGTITLRQALANSCNTAFITQHGTVDQNALADAAAALGFGVDFDLGLPAFVGSIPRTATATEHAASFIGQAKVEASALAMATVVASVVKGATVVPRLVDRTADMGKVAATGTGTGTAPSNSSGAGSGGAASGAAASDGSSAAPGGSTPAGTPASAGASAPSGAAPIAVAQTSPPAPAVPLTAAEAESLRSLMGSVVTDGSGRVLADVGAGGAKTGTAEYGSASPPQTHAWMVAFKGDLAVAVYVETGQSGSRTAAPYLKSFLQRWAG